MNKKKTDDIFNRELHIYTKFLNSIRKASTLLIALKNEFVITENQNNPAVRVFVYFELVVNLRGIVIIALMDLLITSKNLRNGKTKWEKAFYIRQGILIIYEFINVHNKLTKQINPILISNYPEIYDQYKAQSLVIRQFKKRYKFETEMMQLRNNVIGHFNENILEYCKILSSISPVIAQKSINDFSKILTDILNMQGDIEIKLMTQFLDSKGLTLENYKNEYYPLFDLQKMKLPRLLK